MANKIFLLMRIPIFLHGERWSRQRGIVSFCTIEQLKFKVFIFTQIHQPSVSAAFNRRVFDSRSSRNKYDDESNI